MSKRTRKNLVTFLKRYSFEDLATSFFVLNLWLPNIASPIKSQYLFVLLEEMADKLPRKSRIRSYKDFKDLSDGIIRRIPSFPMLEDYVPEADWGEIKFYFEKRFFRLFYGGDLSNSYDFAYAFEATHFGFDKRYRDIVDRSPTDEFKFFLSLQDLILNNIAQSHKFENRIRNGHFETPGEDFWRECRKFLREFDVGEFDTKLVDRFTNTLDASTATTARSTDKEFLSRAFEGKNCFYFFLQKDGRYFPVLPRRHLATLFDTWGNLLFDHYHELSDGAADPLMRINSQFADFVSARTKQKTYANLVTALTAEMEYDETLFATAFLSESKVILVHLLPPPSADKSLQEKMKTLPERFQRVEELLSAKPMKIASVMENRFMSFEPEPGRGRQMEVELVACVPFATTNASPVPMPPEFRWGVISLEQMLALVDECADTNELADFWEYRKNMSKGFSMPGALVSTLDLFGSFKASSSVLIEGATEYTDIMIDPTWGSSYRYRSLSEFWSAYPDVSTFGEPRGWKLHKQDEDAGVAMFTDRTTFDYFRSMLLGDVRVLISAPVGLLSETQGEITETIMDALSDALTLYAQRVGQVLDRFSWDSIHILFFPSGLVKNETLMGHLQNRIPTDSLWNADGVRLENGKFGIRVVFDDTEVGKALLNAADRSIQIELLIDVLRQVGDDGSEELANVLAELEMEKKEKNRFRTFLIEDRVSFPGFADFVVPGEREYKLASKKLAELAKDNEVMPGEYDEQRSKELIKRLIDKLVEDLNSVVNDFDFKTCVAVLLSNVDSLINRYTQDSARIMNAVDQDVEYDLDVSSAEHHIEFVEQHHCYRYLIEKFVQLQPAGNEFLSDRRLAELLAIVGRILHLYFVSDQIHYGIYPATLSVSQDFLISFDQVVDIGEMQRRLTETQAQIRLGLIGKRDDAISFPIPLDQYYDRLDTAFRKDLGFSLRDLINACQVLSHWAHFRGMAEPETFYHADLDEIRPVLEAGIEGFDSSRAAAILEFLTLDPEKILRILGDSQPAKDLPVWEHRKRPNRYYIRPIIRIGESYYWGPYSIERSGKIWSGILSHHKLPSDIDAKNIKNLLDKTHKASTDLLQARIAEIVERITPFIRTEVSPFDLGHSETDIGDIDVFALSSDRTILFNIESKVIDQAYCNKDLKRIAKRIFGEEVTADGSSIGGYLKKVLDRDAFLRAHGRQLAEHYWGKLDKDPQIVSLFVTSEPHWYTAFPVVDSVVEFVEVRLLEDHIRERIRKDS